MKVKDVMHQGASCIDPDAPLTDVAYLMRQEGIGAIPVSKNDRLIGIVTDRDIVVRGLSGDEDPLQLTAHDVMSKPVVYCFADEELEEAIHVMECKRIRRLPVVDAHRSLVGMLSLGDVAAKASPTLCAETMRAVCVHHA